MTMPTIPTPPAAPAPTPEEIYAQQVEAFSDASFAHLSGDALTQAITNMQEAAQDAVDEAARLQTKINADVAARTPDPADIPAILTPISFSAYVTCDDRRGTPQNANAFEFGGYLHQIPIKQIYRLVYLLPPPHQALHLQNSL